MNAREAKACLQELQVELARNKDKLKENPPKTLNNTQNTRQRRLILLGVILTCDDT